MTRPEPSVRLLHNPLSDIETEILYGKASGLRDEDVAYLRGRSVKTVKAQLASIRLKLGARTTSHAVAIAVRDGLIQEVPR